METGRSCQCHIDCPGIGLEVIRSSWSDRAIEIDAACVRLECRISGQRSLRCPNAASITHQRHFPANAIRINAARIRIYLQVGGRWNSDREINTGCIEEVERPRAIGCNDYCVAVLAVIDLYSIEVPSEIGILFCLDNNAIGTSTIDGNRACIAGEHERWTCADGECMCWLGHTVSKSSSEAETKSEQRSNERSS